MIIHDIHSCDMNIHVRVCVGMCVASLFIAQLMITADDDDDIIFVNTYVHTRR